MIGHKVGCGTHRTKNNSCVPRSEMLKRLRLVPIVCQGKMSQIPEDGMDFQDLVLYLERRLLYYYKIAFDSLCQRKGN